MMQLWPSIRNLSNCNEVEHLIHSWIEQLDTWEDVPPTIPIYHVREFWPDESTIYDPVPGPDTQLGARFRDWAFKHVLHGWQMRQRRRIADKAVHDFLAPAIDYMVAESKKMGCPTTRAQARWSIVNHCGKPQFLDV